MSAWIENSGDDLRQGDLLDKCLVPLLGANFGLSGDDVDVDVPVAEVRLIILTQSCDLVVRANRSSAKAESVALCRVYTLDEYTEARSDFSQAKVREEARKGRIEGVHLLHSPIDPEDNQKVLIAHFREIFSLPFDYLQRHAGEQRVRQRLESPYLEHFAQGFARFFMRVGLPLDIPRYR